MTSSTPTPEATGDGQDRIRFSLRTLLIWVTVFCVAIGIVRFFYDGVHWVRNQARANASSNNIFQSAYYLHIYHDEHGSFPPAYVEDKNGKPMHSWRVEMLQHGLGQGLLYDKYDFTQPWNGPNNLPLAKEMPFRYRFASIEEPTTHTNVVAITGPGTAFPGAESTKLDDFKDGLENTIMFVEIANSNISWMEPRDFDIETMSFTINDRDRPSISAPHWRQPFVCFADASVYKVSEDIPPEYLRALMTIDGGEEITREELIRLGYLK